MTIACRRGLGTQVCWWLDREVALSRLTDERGGDVVNTNTATRPRPRQTLWSQPPSSLITRTARLVIAARPMRAQGIRHVRAT